MTILTNNDMIEILQSVGRVYNVTPSMIMGRARHQPLAEARQVAMTIVLLRGVTSVECGRLFGKDHGTALHAKKAINNRVNTCPHARRRWVTLKHLATVPVEEFSTDFVI